MYNLHGSLFSSDSAQTVILILKPDAVPSIAPIPRQPPASSKAALERAQCKLDKDHDEYIASVQGSASKNHIFLLQFSHRTKYVFSRNPNRLIRHQQLHWYYQNYKTGYSLYFCIKDEKLAKTATIGGKVDQWISHQPNNRGDNDSCTLASSVSINQTQAEDEHTSAEEHNNIITTDIADIKRPLQTHLIEEPHVTPLVKERLRPPLIGTPPYPPLIETPPPPLPLKDYKPTDLELSAYQLHMIAAGENNSHITTQIQSRIGSIYPKKEPIDEYYAYPPYYFL